MTTPMSLPPVTEPCGSCGRLHDPALVSCRSYADRQRRRGTTTARRTGFALERNGEQVRVTTHRTAPNGSQTRCGREVRALHGNRSVGPESRLAVNCRVCLRSETTR